RLEQALLGLRQQLSNLRIIQTLAIITAAQADLIDLTAWIEREGELHLTQTSPVTCGKHRPGRLSADCSQIVKYLPTGKLASKGFKKRQRVLAVAKLRKANTHIKIIQPIGRLTQAVGKLVCTYLRTGVSLVVRGQVCAIGPLLKKV